MKLSKKFPGDILIDSVDSFLPSVARPEGHPRLKMVSTRKKIIIPSKINVFSTVIFL